MSISPTAVRVAKFTPQPDELKDVSTTDIAHMVQSLGYAIDELTLNYGCGDYEASDAIGGLAEGVRFWSRVLRNRVTESGSD